MAASEKRKRLGEYNRLFMELRLGDFLTSSASNSSSFNKRGGFLDFS